ncbi:hypothetical protein SAMN05446037_100673 [Anaerovirgula multivorans]|uniref:Uncharacterized protein n=1 Tax=Anaerovirgula multivorans TaxID=312168 RepID=A0A239CPL5_9FIRM|nr:hypothetical protein [Anaerovirgula multivorans]SNS21802.1 hypothetical protein SAMN05446037_100673 [Anaerovirgula multivorans]
MIRAVPNENIIYPILDLIRKEVRQITPDSSLGMPNVKLYREHPLDKDTVTSIELTYESGHVEQVTLGLGNDDVNTYPENMRKQEYEYYRHFRLNYVVITFLSPSSDVITDYYIGLDYAKDGNLEGNKVVKR